MGRYKLITALLLFLTLLAVAYYLTDRYGKSSSLPEVHSRFSIQDTGKVSKIFIADQDGNTVTLEKKRKYWTVNDTFRAQRPQVDMLLETFNNMESKGPVSDARKKTVLKNMSALNEKVEVYREGEEEPFRTYYLGTPTPHQDGTYMLLETPDLGKAERPYIIHIPGRRGFLNPRFFTALEKWRYTGIFNYKLPNIRRVELENLRQPEKSFYIENRPDGYGLFRMKDDERIHDFDTVRLKDYLLAFEKAHVETYEDGLSPSEKDSLIRSGPIYRLRVIDAAGDTNELEAYLKSAPDDPRAEANKEHDVDRMYGRTNDGEFAIIQRYVFGRFFQPISEFQKDYSGRSRGYRRLGPEPPSGYEPDVSTPEDSTPVERPQEEKDTAEDAPD